MPDMERKQSDPLPNFTRLALVLAFLVAIDLDVVRIFWRNLNYDLTAYLSPWYSFIVEHGRFKALGLNFSDYAPPYLYLLSIGTLADRLGFNPVTIIRGIAVAGNAAAGVPVMWFARACGWSRERAILTTLIFVALPEMIVNSLVWGQCDAIYTLFLMAFVYFVINKHGMAAAMMLGVAFAFKLQTIFIGPFVLYLLLVRVLLWRELLLVPLTYFLLMVPAALAGRGWGDLVTIYLRQASEFKELSLNAPNPYLIIQRILPGSFAIGMRVGLVLAVIVALALVAMFVYHGRESSPERLVLLATLSLAVMPYVLPKMHDRYFFPASAMAFLLAVARPRAWPIVALIQTADLCAYTRFLLNSSLSWIHHGFVLMTFAIGLLIWLFFDKDGNVYFFRL